jgi:hypothetical protein
VKLAHDVLDGGPLTYSSGLRLAEALLLVAPEEAKAAGGAR